METHRADYRALLCAVSGLVERARLSAARSVNTILAACYWEIGRHIVEHEQGGRARAGYGERLLARLSDDLSSRYGRGFSRPGLQRMRTFYLGWRIQRTPSGALEARAICSTALSKSATVVPTGETPADLSRSFPLPWSHYIRLMAVEKEHARAFYESEALSGGWSVRQLDRQIATGTFERMAHAERALALPTAGRRARPGDDAGAAQALRDPYLLEFLDLKDEYSESDLEEALIRHLEWFLLELGAGFTFVARQKRLRIGGSWYRMDLLLYHRGLRCLVVVDLKAGPFSHADAGQMNLYLNYAKERLTMPGEAEPVGIILCTGKDDAVVHYATGGIRARVFASRYMTRLPDAETLRRELVLTQRALRAKEAGGDRG